MSFDTAAVAEEIRHWFFDVYFNHWVEVGNGTRDEGPEFVLAYWGTPMYVTVDDPLIAAWLLTDEDVVGFLVMQHTLLKEAGYSHTNVPDQKISVYNANGGAIEVIWSRRAADDTEIQRYAVRFDVARMDGVWKVVGTQARATDVATDQDSVERAWA